MKKAIGPLLIGLLVACAGRSQKTEFVDRAANPDFERGQRALEAENYVAAAEAFDRLLVANPASEFDLVIQFNSGSAHEGMGNCSKAAERYRQVVRSSAGKFPKIEAGALFRLSLMYECLGQDTKAITAMVDTMKRGEELPAEIIKAELPARMAAAYSRIGNRAKALEQFTNASNGLKVLIAQATSQKAQKEVAARTLYFMGRLNSAQRELETDPLGFLQSLTMQQPYLLQSAELGHPLWSRRAQEDLVTSYDNIMRFSIKDPVARKAYWTRAMQVMNELRKIRLPNSGPMVNAVFAQVDKTERGLQIEMASLAETNKLTPDAQRREGLKREGRAVDPKPTVRKR